LTRASRSSMLNRPDVRAERRVGGGAATTAGVRDRIAGGEAIREALR